MSGRCALLRKAKHAAARFHPLNRARERNHESFAGASDLLWTMVRFKQPCEWQLQDGPIVQ